MNSTPARPIALGLGGSSHDFSAALMRGKDLVVAIEEERLSRRKHGTALWFEDPVRRSIDYCLSAAGASLDEVETIVSSDMLPFRAQQILAERNLKLYSHHLCHAASSYMMLPPSTDALVIVIDGMGSVRGPRVSEGGVPKVNRETFSFFLGSGGHIERLGGTEGVGVLEEVFFNNSCTNSVGLLYELVTALLGFHPLDAGKTMGLAGWGTPRFRELIYEYYVLNCDLDHICVFDPYREIEPALRERLAREHNSFAVRADLAASVQAVFEDTLLHCYRLVADHDVAAVCLAGGCALNTVANAKLLKRLGHRRLVVPPHTSDSGVGLGALWLNHREREAGPFSITLRGEPLVPGIGRPGRLYYPQEIQRAINDYYPKLVPDESVRTAQQLARVLADGAVVGVFNGRSEIGPRALGGRSVLADPRRVETRERINRRIKCREPFRPLAPIVLEERFDEFFGPAVARDYYMLTVADATEECRREAPAVVHVDGTARVQVVDETSDLFLFQVLREFYALCGVPMLLNTSFNRRGEPLVETPHDALEAFLAMGLDGLWLDGTFLRAASDGRARVRVEESGAPNRSP